MRLVHCDSGLVCGQVSIHSHTGHNDRTTDCVSISTTAILSFCIVFLCSHVTGSHTPTPLTVNHFSLSPTILTVDLNNYCIIRVNQRIQLLTEWSWIG